jgi:hypothetical protein
VKTIVGKMQELWNDAVVWQRREGIENTFGIVHRRKVVLPNCPLA